MNPDGRGEPSTATLLLQTACMLSQTAILGAHGREDGLDSTHRSVMLTDNRGYGCTNPSMLDL